MKKEKGIFGGFLKGLEGLIDLADHVASHGGTVERQGEFSVPGKKEMRGVYGFTVRSMAGPGGARRPVVETFGNLKKSPKGPVVEEVQEPIVDVFEGKDEIQVVVELPGVDESEIETDIHGDVITLSSTGRRRYSKEILLSSPVDAASAVKSYKNGMFELKLKKST